MELYHVLNRGVDKRNIVLDDRDRIRFLHDLYAFNDQELALHSKLPDRKRTDRRRKLLVRIHAFCLMDNHYHLLLSALIEDGISKYMQKINMGYTKYFNERYARSGTLWQGKYKKILIERDAHFMYIPYYIHLNPLDYKYPEWREGAIKDLDGALKYLQGYRWSSHIDYCGTENFPSITHRNFLSPILGSKERYEKEIGSIACSPQIASTSDIIE